MTAQPITCFWKPSQPFGFLSNWYLSPFSENNVTYINSEQYMMVKKAELFKDDKVVSQLLETTNPATMRTLGRRVANFKEDVWDKNKISIMVDGLTLKFTQTPTLLKKLMDTGHTQLVEASPVDRIWGAGASKDSIASRCEWTGQNLLGLCLMEVRDSIRRTQTT